MSDLAGLRAPDLAEIEALAHEAFAALPDAFRKLCEGVNDPRRGLSGRGHPRRHGLRDGVRSPRPVPRVGLAQSGEVETGRKPNAVWLYRRPLLDYWAEHDETLGDLVTHVLVHEIGHHFGLSDDDMARIEAAAGDE